MLMINESCYLSFITDLSHRLIEECWHENPKERPTFRKIISRLESIYNSFNRRRRWKVLLFFFCLCGFKYLIAFISVS